MTTKESLRKGEKRLGSKISPAALSARDVKPVPLQYK